MGDNLMDDGKRKRNHQKKTNLKLYQNKRSLAYSHPNFDTIEVGVHFYAQMPILRSFSGQSETVGKAVEDYIRLRIGKIGQKCGNAPQKSTITGVNVSFCNETWENRSYYRAFLSYRCHL